MTKTSCLDVAHNRLLQGIFKMTSLIMNLQIIQIVKISYALKQQTFYYQ